MDPQIISWLVSLIAGGAGGLGGELLPKLIPEIGKILGEGFVGTGGLAAILGALLPLIVSLFKKPAAA
ncbi:MAG: hypothetical protein WCI09_11205 [Planctomycetota bacterium]